MLSNKILLPQVSNKILLPQVKYHLGLASNYQVQVFAVVRILEDLYKWFTDNSQKKSYYVFLIMHNRNHVMESQKHIKCNFYNLW